MSRPISAHFAVRNDSRRGLPMTSDDPRMGGYSARELLLATTARMVLAAFREPIEDKQLPPAADAALRLLEGALDPYPPAQFDDFPK